MITKLVFSVLWAMAFIVGFCVIYFVVAFMRSADFMSNAASSAISVSPWVFGVALALGLVGLLLGILGKLPGTR